MSSLIEGSRGGRPGGRDQRPRRLLENSRCHRTSVSRRTRKLLHRSRESTQAAAARNARSAVVIRGRAPPRPRTFSWWRSTAASRSRSSTPLRTSRRSSQHRSRYLKDQSIWASLTAGRPAGERRGQSTDRVSFPPHVAKLTKEPEVVFAFYDFPAEHWIHLRTSNPSSPRSHRCGLGPT